MRALAAALVVLALAGGGTPATAEGGAGGKGGAPPALVTGPEPADPLRVAMAAVFDLCVPALADGVAFPRRLVDGGPEYRPFPMPMPGFPGMVGLELPGVERLMLLNSNRPPACGVIIEGLSFDTLTNAITLSPLATGPFLRDDLYASATPGGWSVSFTSQATERPVHLLVSHAPAEAAGPSLTTFFAFVPADGR